jgi:hypothetical protein
MVILMNIAKGMLNKGEAGFRGYCTRDNGSEFAIVDDLVNQKTNHVFDPDHLIEKLYSRVDSGPSQKIA